MQRDRLGGFEYEVLSVLMQQPRNAYGSTIRERIHERTTQEPSAGAVYTTLDRLEGKGMISSWWGEATAERGGRRKRFYRIEALGADAVRRANEQISHWAAPDGMMPAGA